MPARHRSGRDDRGETLLELVIAVTIMGVTVVAIMGAVATAIMMSDIHRKQAAAGAAVRTYAEAIQQSVATGGYHPCGDETAYATPAGFTAPTGYVSSARSIAYWSGNSASLPAASRNIWRTGCSPDTGLQQLTIGVASADGRADELLVITLRRPCRMVDPPCA